MKLYFLVDKSQFYKRRNNWTTDLQKATVWTTRQGAISAKGSCWPKVPDAEIVEVDVDISFPTTSTSEVANAG